MLFKGIESATSILFMHRGQSIRPHTLLGALAIFWFSPNLWVIQSLWHCLWLRYWITGKMTQQNGFQISGQYYLITALSGINLALCTYPLYFPSRASVKNLTLFFSPLSAGRIGAFTKGLDFKTGNVANQLGYSHQDPTKTPPTLRTHHLPRPHNLLHNLLRIVDLELATGAGFYRLFRVDQ